MPTPPPIIVAHRGLHHDWPENSLEAMAAAFDAGLSAVEWDVRFTADRVAVLMHDDTLDRTTTAAGHLAAARWDDLRGVRLRHKDAVTACVIPRLIDAYHPPTQTQAGTRDLAARMLVVEIKERHAELTRQVLESRHDVLGRVIVQSFDERVIADAMEIDETCDLAILCGNEDELAAGIDACWPRVHMHYKLATREVIESLRKRGVKTGIWTVNAEADLRRVLDLGIEMLITDEPMLAKKLAGAA